MHHGGTPCGSMLDTCMPTNYPGVCRRVLDHNTFQMHLLCVHLLWRAGSGVWLKLLPRSGIKLAARQCR